MSTPVLLVATGTRGYGAARMPCALAKAGFEVALLAPRDALAAKSVFLARVGQLPDHATVRQWLYSFTATVKATSPRLVIPCDDMAFRLLQSVVLAPPQDLRPELQLELAALIRESLGDPAGYRASIDHTLWPPAAAALGVRVPPFVITSDVGEAEIFAATNGYPLVVKRHYAFAGQGVATCSNRDELARAFTLLPRALDLDLDEPGSGRLLVQASLPGRARHYAAAAWQGALLAGWAADTLVADPALAGSGAVFRFHRSPEVRGFAEQLARGFGITGIFALQCIVDPRTGESSLVGIDRGIAPGSHRGSGFDVDLCAALHAALHGVASTSRADLDEGEEGVDVRFPEEWLRDSGSDYLQSYPVDVPWEEPELIEAMLALRHERGK
jgi:hypothetical protein